MKKCIIFLPIIYGLLGYNGNFSFTVLIDSFTDQFGYDKHKRRVILSVLSAEKYGRPYPFSLWFYMIEMSKYLGSSMFKY